jgi:hypothetical protein
MKKFWITSGFCLAAVSCNFYQTFDKPNSDPQKVAAASAYFDAEKYDEALSLLTGVRGGTYGPESAILRYFLTLSDIGMTTDALLQAILNANGKAGAMITNLGKVFLPEASEQTRLRLFDAYSEYRNLGSSEARFVIRFLTSVLFLAELIAEDSAGLGSIRASRLAKNPTQCRTAIQSSTDLLTNGLTILDHCAAPAGGTLLVAGDPLDALTNLQRDDFKGSPSLNLMLACIKEIQDAVVSMSANAGNITSAQNFANQLLDQGSNLIDFQSAAGSPLFRGLLIANEIGE